MEDKEGVVEVFVLVWTLVVKEGKLAAQTYYCLALHLNRFPLTEKKLNGPYQ